VGFIDLPKVEEAFDQNTKRKKISEADINYAKDCIAKHADNYKAMERDIETNYNQFSESQMRKLCTKLRHYEDSV